MYKDQHLYIAGHKCRVRRSNVLSFYVIFFKFYTTFCKYTDGEAHVHVPDVCESDESDHNEHKPVNQIDFAQTAFRLMQQLPRAYDTDDCLSVPDISAGFKYSADDFKVHELLPFTPGKSGETGESAGVGEHLAIHIQKRGIGTSDVQRMIAQFIGCREHNVGYCGLKDVHAVTDQWFSAPLNAAQRRQSKASDAGVSSTSGVDDWHESMGRFLDRKVADNADSDVAVLKVVRHHRKLRPGTHRGNRFGVVLRDCQFSESLPPDGQSVSATNIKSETHCALDLQQSVDKRLQRIQSVGFPNYFGLQRFGRGGSNLRTAEKLINGKSSIRQVGKKARQRRLSQPQTFAVSAFRSFLFNLICASRVRQNTWLTASTGEPLLVGNSRSFFIAGADDRDIRSRLLNGQISTSAALAGCVGNEPAGLAEWWRVERGILDRDLSKHHLCVDIVDRFSTSFSEELGLRHQRRALRVRPEALDWNWLDTKTLELTFELPPGVFATTMLGDLCRLIEPRFSTAN